ncbi:hypothetical protein [Alloactinosynnema sp. L-07]|uniref:hypothetical protein n=1 Tax=Alloactinosynnema sp. L-07 TaxID=1653480 RepID=UPI00065F03BD|nr:hypothetical protein [Alloactinosynnema sp. L-07]CRK57262.1 hypothetical protein [Alloactinosynnema sp. L-07]
MNTTPPVERDLPLDRHLAIRADLQRAMRTKRTRWVPALSAAGALGAVALAVVFLLPQRGGPTAGPPGATSAAGPPVPVIPGLDSAERARMEQGCASGAQVFNLIADDAGRLALLYTRSSVVYCEIGGPETPFDGGFSGVPDVGWLPGHVSIDVDTASAGGDAGGAPGKRPGARGTELVGGRISPDIAKVRVTVGGQTVEAVIANRTYLARFVHPATWSIPESPRRAIVRAYDSAGLLLDSVNDPAWTDDCYETPDGTQMFDHGSRTSELPVCRPAPPWR